MKAKTITYCLILLIICCFESSAQDNLLRKGDDFFAKMQYMNAKDSYEAALQINKSFITHLKLAHTHIQLNDPQNTEVHYKAANKIKPLKSDDKFNLAIALVKNKKHDEALYWLEVYNQEFPHDQRAVNYLQSLNNLKHFYLNSGQYKIKNMAINSKQNDFSPCYYRDGFIFVSGRPQGRNSASSYLWDESAFLDLFYYDIEANKISVFDQKVNSKLHEGPAAFYDEATKFIFTRNNLFTGKIKNSKDGVVKLKLFESEFQNNKWQNFKSFKYNSDEYSSGHPSVTEDGNTLIFASDKPGGKGETDLYKTTRDEEGEWQSPINLGEKINTEGEEMFPFLHEDGTLYFASNGLGGLGGLDIFEAHFDANNEIIWVKNLGHPINSNGDDFGLILNNNKTKGYFSSNRKGGKGKDDIYQVDITRESITVEGFVVDKTTKEKIPNARLKVVEEGFEYLYLLVNQDGFFTFDVDVENVYRLIFKKLKYLTVKDSVSSKGVKPGSTIRLTVEMEKGDYILNAVAVKKNNHLPSGQDVKVTLLNETSGDVTQFTADEDGEIETLISPNNDYLLKAEKKDHFTLSKRFSTKGQQQPKTYEFEFPMEEIVMQKPIVIENIYYDFDKWAIRQDAVPSLNKITQLLKDNPTLKVELSSHTDTRGEYDYNLTLSQKRAESVVEYLVLHGIQKERLIAKGYGKTNPLNYCGGFVTCDEAAHQVNRRTEFKVIGQLAVRTINNY